VELADVLADQGQADEALQLTEISKAGAASDDVAARHALALYDQKGNLVLARKARRMVHELGRA
jgi:hypothetical protein